MIGIIGGTGIYEIVEMGDEIQTKILKTPYGESPEITIFKLNDKNVAFMSRHTKGHLNPPHMINYRANIYAMKQIGVRRIIATNAVGSLDRKIKPGEFLIPHDFLDFTKMRKSTFYDKETVHIDITKPYCPEIRNLLINSENVIENGIYVCAEGPRFEAAAEVKMFQKLGGTVAGMTGLPEVVLAREQEICYASICIISNFAASISPQKLTIEDVFEVIDRKKKDLIDLIYNTIANISENRYCICKDALSGAIID
jgi:5'-methylthioinosine phosphorylase